MKTLLWDAKSGGVWWEHSLQLGAYARSSGYPTGTLPPLDGACLLQVNAKGVTPTFLSADRLKVCGELFEGIKRVYDDQLANDTFTMKDTYELFTDGEVKRYPRVTGVLKQVINLPALNDYLVRQAVEYTLREQIRTKRNPQEVLDAFLQGFFDPMKGSREHMEGRGDEGRQLHRCIETYLRGTPPEIAPELEWLTKAYGHFVKWAEKHDLKAVEPWIEQKVWNDQVAYAGTLDFIATMEPCGLKCCEPWRRDGLV